MNAPEPGFERLGTVELRIPAKPEWVAVARLAVAAVANRLPFSVEGIEDVKLAIAEACTIAIRHADGAETIELVCELSSSALRLRVGARRFSPAPAEDLGIFLIRALMDSVEFTTDDSSGRTELVMSKRLDF